MKFLNLSVMLFTATLMTACVSGSSSDTQTANASATSTVAASGPSVSTAPEPETEISIAEITGESSPGEISAAQVEILPWLRIPMHYEVLMGQPQIWNEVDNTLALNLAQAAFKSSTTLAVNSTEGLLPQQLISYLGSDGEYYSAQIQSIENKTLSLTTPLQQSLFAGANAWNFYSNGSHPNTHGYRAIADYAVRFLGKDQLNEGTHILLGDSWFDEGSILERLKVHLPIASFINKGIGGSTSTDLLARFDADVTPHNPNFVWIMSGTNDYWQEVTPARYKSNIDALVTKIKAMNAVPIVFDSSVGTLNFGLDTLTVRSQAYVTVIDQLLAED